MKNPFQLSIDITLINQLTVNFSCTSGDIVGIKGRSGIGKSLLLRAIAGLDYYHGNISLAGTSQVDFAPQAWRRTVMMTPAQAVWWESTIEAHFLAEKKELLLDAMQQINLESALLTRSPTSLSTGEQQRFALLRTLLQHPQVLLLDEPTSQLDDDTTFAVEQLIQQWPSLHTVLWVSHQDQQLKRMCNTIHTLGQTHDDA